MTLISVTKCTLMTIFNEFIETDVWDYFHFGIRRKAKEQ